MEVSLYHETNLGLFRKVIYTQERSTFLILCQQKMRNYYDCSFFMFLVSPTPLLGPLVIWLLKKRIHSFIDYHGREIF